MKVKALKDCPQGQRPGDVFEVHEDVAKVLMLVEAVEPYEEHTTPRRRYTRRDLTAED